MGLGGRKIKQRIPDDPRNLSWADDAARFGSNYLSKFGWDASQGLGVDGEGRTSHIKVSHKLDMLGIGAAHQKDPNGIAWKQNKDFENLLKRLNENATEIVDGKEEQDVVKEETPKKKRKQKGDEEKDTKKKRRKTEDSSPSADEVVPDSLPADPAPVRVAPRYRAHRARAIAAKSITSKSAAAISEILGIAPSSGLSVTTTQTTGKLTSLTDDATIEKLTTSTKSVADYFKEKLLVRATQSESTTPISEQDAYDLPRSGLGSGRARFEIQEDDSEMGARRVGLSKFSSLMSSQFLAATSTLSTPPEITESEDVATAQLDTVEEEQTSEEKRKKKKGDKDEKKEKKLKDKVTRTEVKDPDTLQTASLDDVDRKARKAQRKAEKARKAAENNLH